MSAVLETDQLGKRYRRRWALQDCTLSIPGGKVVGLVGPNGAGTTTLLDFAAGLLSPAEERSRSWEDAPVTARNNWPAPV